MTEKVGAFGWREACDKFAESVPECVDGSDCPGAQQCFEFGEGQLDWVEIGTVWRQIQQPGAGGLDRLADPGDLVRTEIVHDDDVAVDQRGNQHLLDVGEEQLAIDCAVEHAGGNQAVLAQPGNEGGGVPVPVRYRTNQPFAPFGPAVEPDHIGLGPGFINEDQPARIKRRLALAPFRTSLRDVRPILLGGPERLFLSVRPSSFNVCQISPTLAAT